MVVRIVNILLQRVGNGAWSFEGLQRTDTDGNDTMVQCISTHLTSFAILVNVGGSMTYHVSFLDAYGMYICILPRCSTLHSKISSVSNPSFSFGNICYISIVQ